MDTSPDRTISLFHEGTGRLVGKISESELRVLKDALEEEGPDDDDYWINPEAIDGMSRHPDATPHLISLLRDAVGEDPDGADVRFVRDGAENPPA